MKIVYCIFSIVTAYICGVAIAFEDWVSAIVNCICAFTNARWFIKECSRNRIDDNVEK